MDTVPCVRCGNPVKVNAFTCRACGIFRPGKPGSIATSGGTGPELVCTRCGHMGPTKEEPKGSGWIELILYLWLIVPGLLYSVWRRSGLEPRCALCNSTDLVPESSPIGAELIARTHR